jgi:hypothetical protein
VRSKDAATCLNLVFGYTLIEFDIFKLKDFN